MTRREVILPEPIEIKIPSKDRDGKPIPDEKRDEWIRLWRAYLLSPDGMNGEGYEALSRTGTWRKGPKGSFDPKTGELQCTDEHIAGIKIYCSARQLRVFMNTGKKLLVRMGRELNQEAVAFETRKGLHVIRLRWADEKPGSEA